MKNKYVCHCGKECRSKAGFKLHLKTHNKRLFALSAIAIIEFILLLLLVPAPFFSSHTTWEDLFNGGIDSVDIHYLGDNTGKISFEVTNNNPHIIDDVIIVAELDCGSEEKKFSILLDSKVTTIPPETSGIFYIDDEELLSSINAPTGSDLEYKENVDSYPVYLSAKNKNIYILNNNGEITKGPLSTENVTFYEISCDIISKLQYSYIRFGRSSDYEKDVQELTIAAIDKTKGYGSTKGPFAVGHISGGGYLDDTCKKFCETCSSYPDFEEALRKNTISNTHLCMLWVCDEIKRQYPEDTISCLGELYDVCLWHEVKAGETLSMCSDIDRRLKTECMLYENDECRMYGTLEQ